MAEFKCRDCGALSGNIYYDDEAGKRPFMCVRCAVKVAANTMHDADIGRAVRSVVEHGLVPWFKKKFKIGEL